MRQERLKEKRRFKLSLPSLMMGNVRSLTNKMEELTGLVRSQTEYRECSVMCFMGTWLHQDILDHNVSVEGFLMVQADRDCNESGKRKGEGLAILVNTDGATLVILRLRSRYVARILNYNPNSREVGMFCKIQ